MASFLDSLSLSQLALVSRLLRDVCSSLLSDRGMVTLRWQRRTGSQGRAEWRVGEKVGPAPPGVMDRVTLSLSKCCP